ncbi:MAG: Mg2+ transporter [Chlamydiales bacterium]|jgi:magnesium transporter|nr:Mg2+ transporter [Chlamydiales bacterium]
MQTNPVKSSIRYAYLDDLLLSRLDTAFIQEDEHEISHLISKITAEYNCIDLAYAASHLSREKRSVLYKHLPNFETKLNFILHADDTTCETIFEELSDEEVCYLIEMISPQRAVEILELLNEEKKLNVLTRVEPRKLVRIRQIQQYDENSAGRIMTNEFFAFSLDTTIGMAATYIREFPHFDLTHNVYVLSHAGTLLGCVPVRSLIVSPSHLPLRQVVKPIYHKVFPNTPRENIVMLFERYNLGTLPVVDYDNNLLGVVSDTVIVKAMEDIVDETIAHMAGTDEDISENVPLNRRFWARIPWLFGTACGGIINMKVQSSFQWFEFGIFFVSLITGLSGNIGLQCSTVLVRNMATESFSMRNQWETLRKELIIGTLAGLTFGLFCGSVVYSLVCFHILDVQAHALKLAVIVGCGLVGACVNATLLGVLSPLFFSRIGVDPAVAAGPIVTAFNDILSTVIYFCIAQAIYSIWIT